MALFLLLFAALAAGAGCTLGNWLADRHGYPKWSDR